MSSSSDLLASRARIIRQGGRDISRIPFDRDLREPEPVDAEALARAWQEGYDAGLAEGSARGRARTAADEAHADERAQSLSTRIASEATRLREQLNDNFSRAEDDLARTAFALAEAILGRELELAASPGEDAIARAIGLLTTDVAGRAATARLHPADVSLLPDDPGAGHNLSVNVVPDAGLQRGDCVLEIGDSRIDARLSGAIDRARAAFLGGPAQINGVDASATAASGVPAAAPALEDGA